MKVGTAPKVTVGAAVLIGLIFIGYIGIRHMNAPTVAGTCVFVAVGGWHCTRSQSSPEGLAAQTDSTPRYASPGDTPPQIASAASAEDKELIDNLYAETRRNGYRTIRNRSGL